MCLPLSYSFTVLVVPKCFSYAQFRRSGKPPSDEGGGFAVGEDGGRETRRENSLPQSFATQNPAPSSEGAVGVQITAYAVVRQDTRVKEYSLSL